ncbi:MAG: DUF5818 domain-containing protein [Terriglobales bacterium]
MPKIQFALPKLLPTLAVLAGLCFICQASFAQNSDEASGNSAGGQAHSQPMQPAHIADRNNDGNGTRNSEMTFQGRIVKSGSRLVLTGTDDTTYQLDNQQKAHNFLNQQVKITGILDATTGTIRINAIDPV